MAQCLMACPSERLRFDSNTRAERYRAHVANPSHSQNLKGRHPLISGMINSASQRSSCRSIRRKRPFTLPPERVFSACVPISEVHDSVLWRRLDRILPSEMVIPSRRRASSGSESVEVTGSLSLRHSLRPPSRTLTRLTPL